MKNSLLLLVMFAAITTGCQKEMKLRTGQLQQGSAQADVGLPPPICINEHWDPSGPLTAGSPNIHLVYNNKAYFPQNANGNPAGNMTVQIYDGTSWQVKPCNIPILTNYKNFAFTIGNKGYVAYLHFGGDFYQYDFANNTWTRKADFPGSADYGVATFTVGNKAYVVGGTSGDGTVVYQETWEYNPATNHWTRKANLAIGRSFATGFSISNKGYVVNGAIPFGDLHSLFEYDPVADTWTSKALFPGIERIRTQAFVIDGIAYAGGGWDDHDNLLRDFYKYDVSTNTWTRILDIDLPSGANSFTDNSFSINSLGYVGWEGNANDPRLRKYTPQICFQ